jgi:hypothetical protein
MDYGLKGVTKLTTIESNRDLELKVYSFDLRPRSFNFTPMSNIKNIISSANLGDFTLLFENEKDFVLNEFIKEFKLNENHVHLEFSGTTQIEELDALETPYSWHYHPEIKISQISKTRFMKRIVFGHQLLEHFNDNGELFGFLSLFKDLVDGVEFELQLDWDSPVLESMFEYFKFDFISFEIDSKIETSYQNVNEVELNAHIKTIQKIFLEGKKDGQVSTDK